MEKYVEYKDSGIPWIGNIPAHWSIQRGKNVLILLDRPVNQNDEVITCFRDGEVTLRKNRREDGFTVSLQEIGYQGVEPGDLVVHGMDGFAGSIGISDSRGKATPVLNVMDSLHNKRFLMYYLRMAAYKDVFMSLSTGIRVRSCDLRWNKLSIFPFVLPNPNEQDQIVNYIDENLKKIDTIIAEAKASIEEYKAWKASIIYEAITKGLDPDVEMKDSGVEWIGTIPNDWSVQRLKTLICEPLQYGANETGIEYSDELPRYIRITDVTANGTLKENGKLSLPEEVAGAYILQDCDILLARSGGTVGKAFFYKAEYGRAAFAGYMIRARVNPDMIHPKLVYFSTLSANYDDWKATTMTQATIQNIGANKYNDFYVVVPPIKKQELLVSYIENKTEEIDALITEKESLVLDLEAYKKSLIFETVTGKRKVV